MKEDRWASVSRGFESHLGLPDERYFGHGYRRTRHRLALVESFPGDDLRAMASVTYAQDWSMRSGRPRVPHLSSIDAVVLSARMGQAYLESHGLSADQVGRAWVSHLSVRTGPKPTKALEDVPAATRLIASSPIDDTRQRSDLRVRVGNFVGKISLVHENPAGARILSQKAVEVPSLGIYTHLYQQTKHRVGGVHVSADGTEVSCVTSLEMSTARPSGLSSDYWPMPTLIDSIVIAGQMAEVLIYSHLGLDRERSTGMWLRRISMRAPHPTAHVLTGSSTVRLTDMRRHRRDHASISTFDFICEVCDVQIESSLVDTA